MFKKLNPKEIGDKITAAIGQLDAANPASISTLNQLLETREVIGWLTKNPYRIKQLFSQLWLQDFLNYNTFTVNLSSPLDESGENWTLMRSEDGTGLKFRRLASADLNSTALQYEEGWQEPSEFGSDIYKSADQLTLYIQEQVLATPNLALQFYIRSGNLEA